MTKSPKKVLVDSSSMILLEKSDVLTEFCTLYRLLIADSVYREISHNSKAGARAFSTMHQQGRIEVLPALHDKTAFPASPAPVSMDRGERETLLYFLKGKSAFVVLDDRKAIKYCIQRDIPFVNALLIPKILFLAGKITPKRFKEQFKRIQSVGYYSQDICNRAIALQACELQQFLP